MLKPLRTVQISSMVSVFNPKQPHVIFLDDVESYARYALAMLIDEFGTEGARRVLYDEFKKYHRDWKGIAHESRPAKIDQPDLSQSTHA
ncbi:hypothetical protein [Pseudomonas turukhanskensis]|uniref:Uncharacterized protein n=1 Tax=Pseudomonas turukhanskensis TaxID=1806536 RepID=A0A9W6NEU5_9PSED|nr:hypothetical protein [Pseudomonas turukhanskensis]GLK88333.1 hypothetical protein GCM10017655_13950 [Pseudomonas turukhanskensis]